MEVEIETCTDVIVRVLVIAGKVILSVNVTDTVAVTCGKVTERVEVVVLVA